MRTRISDMLSGTKSGIGKYQAVLREAQLGYGSDAPHEFVEQAYREYLERFKSIGKVNGDVFEYIICESLAQRNLPFHYRATLKLPRPMKCDVLLYNANNPIVLMLGVSLRERHWSAELESFLLKQTYKNAECYIVMKNPREYRGIAKRIRNREYFSLNDCVLADSTAFSNLLKRLDRLNKNQNTKFERASAEALIGDYLFVG